MPENEMAVGELARITGISPSAINYYVRVGVLPPPRKTSRTRAAYDRSYVDRIARIRELKAQGLPLRIIARVLDRPRSAAGVEAVLPAQPPPAMREGGPGTPVARDVDEYLELTGLDRDRFLRLAQLGLIQPRSGGREGKGPRFGSREVAAGRALATLLDAGVSLRLLARHREYDPLARAEAHFLAEHIAAAGGANATAQAAERVASAFSTLREHLRLREFARAYPDWPPGE